jgi:hypothetical protein
MSTKMKTRRRKHKRNAARSDPMAPIVQLETIAIWGGLAFLIYWIWSGGLTKLFSSISPGGGTAQNPNWWCTNFNLFCPQQQALTDTGLPLLSPPANVGVGTTAAGGNYNYLDTLGNVHDVNVGTQTDTIIGNSSGPINTQGLNVSSQGVVLSPSPLLGDAAPSWLQSPSASADQFPSLLPGSSFSSTFGS